MKLELKHIAPYLPHGLPIQIFNHKCDYVGIEFSKVNGYYFIGDSLHVTYEGGSAGKDQSVFKPLLRPMSDLTRPMLEQAGFVCHIDWLTNEFQHWVEEYGLDHVIDRTPFGHIKYLLENHFDVFGLIVQGLAIDINTIQS